MRDFAELANRFEWNAEDIEEMKGLVRMGKGMKEWLERLAYAYRSGYQQMKENNYMRLYVWELNNKEV